MEALTNNHTNQNWKDSLNLPAPDKRYKTSVSLCRETGSTQNMVPKLFCDSTIQ